MSLKVVGWTVFLLVSVTSKIYYNTFHIFNREDYFNSMQLRINTIKKKVFKIK